MFKSLGVKTLLACLTLTPGAAFAQEAVNTLCPVGKEPIDGKTFVEHKGNRVGFCCPGCDSAFLGWEDARKDRFVRVSLTSHISEPSHDQAPAQEGPSYPYTLDTCPVSGEKLGSMGDPVVREYDGREVRLCCAGCIDAFEADKAKHWAAIDTKIVQQQLMHYPVDTCIVTGDKLDETVVNHVHNNRLVRLANPEAAKAFKSEPAKYLSTLDKKIVQQQLGDYPMEQCPVGGALGSMGEPINFIYMNRLVRFCCGGCEDSLVKEPAKYMAKLDRAYADAQRESYPIDACVVSGAPLGSMGDPVELVAGTKLVRFCCDGCFPAFRKGPAKYLAKLK
jgi:YHS domain-containing protein